ncbi:type 1 glutamine amidotransferase [Polycladidibacter hongkongensis]|uniref:type 1 glutamine amidotransferase n=1 Tax=Polycladidibacter hongkongensis TaxID=1647556 RepID=UPI00082FF3FF|nr:type 1 glutamine amidotransferase [Pseudovibrio hongkongensis]
MHILCIENCQHVELGLLGAAIASENARLTYLRPWQQNSELNRLVANTEHYDGLIVLGGLQNAQADVEHPFLPQVCALFQAFHAVGKPVLGICLGSQLIARAFGAENILAQPVEAGWLPLQLTEAAQNDPVFSCLSDGDHQFILHTDTYSLPEGAIRLASSHRTPNQAFRIGRGTYAVQFHFECGREEVAKWNTCFAQELASLVPNWSEIQNDQAPLHGPRAEALGLELSHRWLALVKAAFDYRCAEVH